MFGCSVTIGSGVGRHDSVIIDAKDSTALGSKVRTRGESCQR